MTSTRSVALILLTQCCFLSHRLDAGAGVLSSVSMGNVNIEEADALHVLGKRISCDARWNAQIFEWRRKH